MNKEELKEILFDGAASSIEEVIKALQEKSIFVPAWGGNLEKEYDPTQHPVTDKQTYPDVVNAEGRLEKVTRITYDMQRLAVKRMSELINGIPIKRIYKPQNERQQDVAKWIDRIFQRNRINSVDIERSTMLFAGCEVMTLWYAVEEKNNYYGFNSPLKMRCRNFSPMLGDELYPLFDEYGDMIAMSIGYTRKVGNKDVSYFDTYTEENHWKFSNGNGWYENVEFEEIKLGKIPCIYMYRPTPIWEDTSKIVYEMEWAMSRNGNYLRKNSKPFIGVFADDPGTFGKEKNENEEFRGVLSYPKGSDVKYITWEQAIDNLKFYITELRQSFFTQLQLPDWSYENMKATPMSGESRKQLFIDCQLKVKDESGRFMEFMDREVNVVKAFLKQMVGKEYHNDIDALGVEIEITPYTIADDKDTIKYLMDANGGKPLMSQKESIEYLGWTDDAEKTIEEIRNEELAISSKENGLGLIEQNTL